MTHGLTADDVLYGKLLGGPSTEQTDPARVLRLQSYHPTDIRRALELSVFGYFWGEAGFSGCEKWAVQADTLPDTWTRPENKFGVEEALTARSGSDYQAYRRVISLAGRLVEEIDLEQFRIPERAPSGDRWILNDRLSVTEGTTIFSISIAQVWAVEDTAPVVPAKGEWGLYRDVGGDPDVLVYSDGENVLGGVLVRV